MVPLRTAPRISPFCTSAPVVGSNPTAGGCPRGVWIQDWYIDTPYRPLRVSALSLSWSCPRARVTFPAKIIATDASRQSLKGLCITFLLRNQNRSEEHTSELQSQSK